MLEVFGGNDSFGPVGYAYTRDCGLLWLQINTAVKRLNNTALCIGQYSVPSVLEQSLGK